MRQRKPRQRDERHLDFIRQLPCLITARTPVEAAHIRYADLPEGKSYTGKGEKPDDKYTVPLHADQHRLQHSMNEREFWKRARINPVKASKLLFAVSGNFEQAAKILTMARVGRIDFDD